ncbi:hypothetical protein DBB42_05105 [Pseudomonas plecoglossicida]|uniref:Uncharacterized protein n=1 Tax=Pseudomonas plecoglossicida TaxID=70775 RepID=A0A2R7UMJ5_PSEDL|nr:hypothetical protein DBB42_05105 [Pseudomonas plecoglossicida]
MRAFLLACAGLFAGEPAPTGIALHSASVQYLWERVHPRKGRYRRCKISRQKKGAPTKRPTSRKAHNKFSWRPAAPSLPHCTLRSAPSRRS